jgi:predicted ATPase
VAQPPILTPDRRLRVFVSSTLGELAAERAAAREAIASLRLAPVMFEQGARPHAPRDLYAAYVGQSDVFVGIYWQSYGWIARGAAISGIEDEFELGQGKPMLLYVKEPAPGREAGLRALIRRIEEEAGSAYRTFGSAGELRALVTDDLAHLLTERFHANAAGPEELSELSALPARTTSFVGRARELEEITCLFERPGVRLVTLTGPGGIGKTELALEVARRRTANGADGAAYVALDRLTDPELVPGAIADALGLAPLGPDRESGLARLLRERRVLLVLDNFEHLLDAAPGVTRLLAAADGVKVLATSREPLRLQGEHEYPVPPLADAPALFMEVVAAVRPGIAWSEENTRAAQEICDRVDCLPLAVELVGACARMFEPRVLVNHLGASLDTPSVGRRDAPARQLTMRATMDWSYGLLVESERDLFERLAVFAGSFSIEAVQSLSGDRGTAVLATLSALVEKSLLVHEASESETRFCMLQVVAEYAGERLAARADADEIRDRHAAHYEELARVAYPGLRGSEQRGWKEVFDLERENVRRALAHLARVGRLDDAAALAWSLWGYWFAGAYLEGRKVVEELIASPGELSDQARARLRAVAGLLAAILSDPVTAQAELGLALEWFQAHDDDEGRATALAGLGIATAPSDADRARTLMLESAHLFARIEDFFGEAVVLNALGWLDAGRGEFAAPELIERAYVLARGLDNDVATAHAATDLAELRIAQQRFDEARELVVVSLKVCEALQLYDGASYALEPAALVAVANGESENAARLLGAADQLRHEAGIPIWGPRLDRFETLKSSARDRDRLAGRANPRLRRLTRRGVSSGSMSFQAGAPPLTGSASPGPRSPGWRSRATANR